MCLSTTRRVSLLRSTSLYDSASAASMGLRMTLSGLTWAADAFWCDGWPGDAVPLLSGGILAVTQRWWRYSGGLGPVQGLPWQELQGWGGENIDQSLRTWLCGGEIRAAHGSRVAHLWRDQSPGAAPRYAWSERQVLRNRLRAAEAWLGPWARKVRSFPEFQHVGNHSLKGLRELQRRLGCAPFGAYVKHFQALFENAGMLPDSVFHLQFQQVRRAGHLRKGELELGQLVGAVSPGVVGPRRVFCRVFSSTLAASTPAKSDSSSIHGCQLNYVRFLEHPFRGASTAAN